MPPGVDSDGMRVTTVYDPESNRPRIPVRCELQSGALSPDEPKYLAKAIRDLMIYSKANDYTDRETVDKVYSMIEDGILQGSFKRENIGDLIAEAEKFDAWVTAQREEIAERAKEAADLEMGEDIPEETIQSGTTAGVAEVAVPAAPNHA